MIGFQVFEVPKKINLKPGFRIHNDLEHASSKFAVNEFMID